MGLNKEEHQSKTFLSIVNGKFAKRVPEGTEGATEREIEYEGKKRMIWEMLYGSLDAKIDSIELKEGGKFGDQIDIGCSDIGEHFTISLNLQGREAKGFMMCLPNIDLTKYVKFEPYNYVRKSDQKKMIGLGVKQGADNVKYFYSKENGLPGVDETAQVDKDEFKLLMAQQTIWLKKKTKAFIAEKFSNKSETAVYPPQNKSGGGDEERAPGDDLPFRFNPKLFTTNV